MAHTMSKRQARAVQEATGLPYQRCLQWVQDNHDALREKTGAMVPEHGLKEAGRRAAMELALLEFPPILERGT